MRKCLVSWSYHEPVDELVATVLEVTYYGEIRIVKALYGNDAEKFLYNLGFVYGGQFKLDCKEGFINVHWNDGNVEIWDWPDTTLLRTISKKLSIKINNTLNEYFKVPKVITHSYENF